MRLFVLLALAALSAGCHGNLFREDTPKPPVEALTDAFWDYIAKASKSADDTLEMVVKSRFGAQVNAQLAETAEAAGRYVSSLKEELPRAARGLAAQIGAEARALRAVLSRDLSRAGERMEAYSDSLKSRIRERLDGLRRELGAYADAADPDGPRAALTQRGEELLELLQGGAERNLGSFRRDLMERVDRHLTLFLGKVGPLAHSVQEELYSGGREVGRAVAPYAEDLKDRLDHLASDLQEQLKALVNER